jgi:hypothetical protein
MSPNRSEKPILVVKALAGLANRLRVIDSAAALAEKFDRSLEIIWNKERSLLCRYDDLFLPHESFQVRHQWYDTPRTAVRPWESVSFVVRERFRMELSLGGNTWLIDKHPSFLGDVDFSRYSGQQRLFISTAHRFGNGNILPSLRPVPEVSDRIERVVADFTAPTYGMHIRRGDSLMSVRESPSELFFAKAREILDREPDARIFLATDDASLRASLTAAFPGAILYRDKPVVRDSKEGIRDALIDLWCLSRTRKIFGSYYSSFSATSAMIGGKPMEVLRVNQS